MTTATSHRSGTSRRFRRALFGRRLFGRVMLAVALLAPTPLLAQRWEGGEGLAAQLEGAFDAAASQGRRPAGTSGYPPAGWWSAPAKTAPGALALRLRQKAALVGDADLNAFYAARDWRPLWIDGGVRPEAGALIAQLRQSAVDGLDPKAYAPDRLETFVSQAGTGDPDAEAQAEIELSRALADYAVDLKRGRGVKLAFVDPETAAPSVGRRSELEAAAEARSLQSHIRRLPLLNPVYVSLRQVLADDLERGADLGSEHELLLRANLERARALPPVKGRRFILVNAAAARLWLIEDGRVIDSMKVVVGKREQPTPMMVGLVRYAIYNPYWNVPEDLTRTSIAAKVLKQGLPYLNSEGMEVLANWDDDAKPLDPAELDWGAVASGKRQVRVRQRPGEKNMMGAVKLMLPNPLGVYLHDTPNKAAFDLQERLLSSGCVRLEDALRLASHLVPNPPRGLGPYDGERQVDLPEPTPVYITYLTLAPEPGGLARYPDIYQRDAALIASLRNSGSGPSRVTLAAAR